MEKGGISGYLFVLMATTLWGLSSVVPKSLFNDGLSPFELVQIRLTLAALILFIVLFSRDRNRLVVSVKDLPRFFIFGVVGMLGNQLSFYFTMSKIQVAPTVFLQYLFLVWIALFAFLFQKESLTKWTLAALFFAIAGSYLVVGGYRFDLLRMNKTGIMSGLISSLFASFYALYGERELKRHDTWTLLLYGFGFGAAFCSILNSPIHLLRSGYSLKIWLASFYIATFATLIPFGLYFKGIERIRATRAGITATWEPVMSGMAAYFVLGEALHPFQMLGGLGVIASVFILQIEREKAASSPF